MTTWKLTERQLTKVAEYARAINRRNAHVKMVPNIIDEALLGISVRFLAPKSWRDVTPENSQLERLIYQEIEERSRHRLFPERSELFRRGVLDLKYVSVHREANEHYILEAMKFIANDLIDVMIGKKEL